MPRTLVCFAAVCLLAADTPKEDGFTSLFNGKDLKGWKTQGKKGESLDGKTEAYKSRFTVKDEKIVIDPKVKGDVRIETEKKFAGDVVLRFDFLPGPKCNNDLFFRGHKFDLSQANVKKLELGKWHSFEIAVKGEAIEFKLGGEVLRKGKVKAKAATPLEVRAEFGEMELRNIRFKE